MTKMFGNLTDENLEKTGDVLGGGGPVESGIYTGTVKLAYAGKSNSSNAQSIVVHIDTGNREIRESLWVTNRNGENFYADKKDPNKKRPLPGYTTADDLCLVTTGHPLSEQDLEEKVVNLFDFEARAERPQNVPVLVDVIGKEVTVAVLKQTVDKNVQDSSGKYVPSGETRDENVIDKVFHAESQRTVTEIREGLEEGKFLEAWKAKNEGQTRNRAKGADGKTGAPGGAGAPPARGNSAPGNAKPKTSLFGS